MMILIVGVSAGGQKKKKGLDLPGRPIVSMPNIVIQDDAGGGFIDLNPTTGAYKCNFCVSNYVMYGTGQAKIEGCSLYFSDIKDGYRLVISVDLCLQQGKAAIEVDTMPDGTKMSVREYWTDIDLRNDNMECVQMGIAPQLPRPLPPPTEATLINIQDDLGNGFIVFNTSTGEYKCHFCKYNYTMYGTGQIKTDGCNLYFEDLKDGYRILISVNLCDHQGKAAIEVDTMPDGSQMTMREYWTDINMGNSIMDCVGTISK
jgi:hypothetical protein